MTKTQEKIIAELEIIQREITEEIERFKEMSQTAEGKEDYYAGIEKGLKQAYRIIQRKIRMISIY